MTRTKKIYASLSVFIGLVILYYMYFTVYGFIQLNNISSKYGYDSITTDAVWMYVRVFVPELIGLISIILFAATKFKRSELLRLYFCFTIISIPNNILNYIAFFKNRYSPAPGLSFYVGTVLQTLFFVACGYGLWVLSRRRKVLLNYSGEGEMISAEFAPASHWKRLANYLIDFSLMFYTLWVMMLTIISLLRQLDDGSMYSYRRSNLNGFPYWFYLWPFLYYLILEGIFKTSAGKSLTNTVVVNDRAERPNFGQMLGRSLCRYIPFETFSFLAGSARGWHDSLTETYVCDSVNEEFTDEDEKEITEFLNRDIITSAEST